MLSASLLTVVDHWLARLRVWWFVCVLIGHVLILFLLHNCDDDYWRCLTRGFSIGYNQWPPLNNLLGLWKTEDWTNMKTPENECLMTSTSFPWLQPAFFGIKSFSPPALISVEFCFLHAWWWLSAICSEVHSVVQQLHHSCILHKYISITETINWIHETLFLHLLFLCE